MNEQERAEVRAYIAERSALIRQQRRKERRRAFLMLFGYVSPRSDQHEYKLFDTKNPRDSAGHGPVCVR